MYSGSLGLQSYLCHLLVAWMLTKHTISIYKVRPISLPSEFPLGIFWNNKYNNLAQWFPITSQMAFSVSCSSLYSLLFSPSLFPPHLIYSTFPLITLHFPYMTCTNWPIRIYSSCFWCLLCRHFETAEIRNQKSSLMGDLARIFEIHVFTGTAKFLGIPPTSHISNNFLQNPVMHVFLLSPSVLFFLVKSLRIPVHKWFAIWYVWKKNQIKSSRFWQ